MSNKENPLGSSPILSLIAKFAIPSIIAMLVAAVYNITDQIFIGHIVGMYGNAATNVAFPFINLTTAFAQLAGVGAATGFNINQGAKREEDAERFIHTGITLFVTLGIFLFAVARIFMKPLLWAFGATENSYAYALAYFGITSFGLPFLLFTNSSAILIRADGSPTYSMIAISSGAILNIGLDWLFMVPLKLGIQGAALATVTGQILSAGLCVRYYFRFNAFKIKPKSFGLGSYTGKILRYGIPAFSNHAIMMITNVTMNNVLTTYGAMSIFGEDIPLAVAGVVMKLNTIMIGISVGLAQGCQPIWGFNLGAKQYGRVKEAWLKAAGIALCFGLAFFAMFQLIPRTVISIFGTGTELYYQFAELYLKRYMFMVGLASLQPLSVNFFSATGNVKKGTVLSLSRQGLFLIPLLLILPRFFGINGIIYAGPIADTMAIILALTLVFTTFRGFAKDAEA